MLAEFYLSPTMENCAGSSQPQMDCFPACRWTYFVKGHKNGGKLLFVDGHSGFNTNMFIILLVAAWNC